MTASASQIWHYTRGLIIFTLTDTQLTKILNAAGLSYDITRVMTRHFTYELLRLREEVLKAHAWSEKGPPSTLKKKLGSLPRRLKALIKDLGIDATYSLRPALLEASQDKYGSSESQRAETERLKTVLDRITIDLRDISVVVEHLSQRLKEYELLQSPRGSLELMSMDELETAEYLTSMGALFRRFKKHDQLDSPLVLSLIVLSRLFQQLFPGQAFEARTQHSKHGDAILYDLRYNTPGVRFAAAALKELRLKQVFKKSTMEEYINAVGDGWNNHKDAIASRGSLIPNPLHSVALHDMEDSETPSHAPITPGDQPSE
jgi:hypothetical protein